MTDQKYKYDVALSFAEEDKAIAEQIAKSCKKAGLKPYFYEYENAENWGENIFNIIVNRYKEAAHFSLILISKNYIKKRWSNIERQIIQGVSRESGSTYLLPLRLDATELPGLTDNILFKKWGDNADDIAQMIKQKIASLKKPSQNEIQKDNSTSTIINQNTVINRNVGTNNSVSHVNGNINIG